jgi:hypothetical protein
MAYTQVLQNAEAQISIADKGEAWQNGHAERLIRTIKEEEVDLSEYLDYHDAYQQIGRFLDDVICTSGSGPRWGEIPQPNSTPSGGRSIHWSSIWN